MLLRRRPKPSLVLEPSVDASGGELEHHSIAYIGLSCPRNVEMTTPPNVGGLVQRHGVPPHCVRKYGEVLAGQRQ